MVSIKAAAMLARISFFISLCGVVCSSVYPGAGEDADWGEGFCGGCSHGGPNRRHHVAAVAGMGY